MSSSLHVPVLTEEVLFWLQAAPGKVLVDGTLGGGGHTARLIQAVGPQGLVIGLDRDPAAIAQAEQRFAGQPLLVCHSNFCELPEVLAAAQRPQVDGIVLDVGLSSDQLADPQRGFSFHADGPLDLRFNPQEGEPAWRLVERLSEAHLADLIYAYGEERYSRRIARKIGERRRQGPLREAKEFADLIRLAVPPPRTREARRIDPATRTFQALRIAVNDELQSLEIALKRFPVCLVPGGRLVVISFHSLEDRRVKNAFRDDDRYVVLTRKAIQPKEAELVSNPRARSARLRAAARANPAF